MRLWYAEIVHFSPLKAVIDRNILCVSVFVSGSECLAGSHRESNQSWKVLSASEGVAWMFCFLSKTVGWPRSSSPP